MSCRHATRKLALFDSRRFFANSVSGAMPQCSFACWRIESADRRSKDLTDGQRTNRSDGKRILTDSLGAIPIINRLFQALDTRLIMDIMTHTVGEFDVSLNELHNDSTTVTFSGEYPTASGPHSLVTFLRLRGDTIKITVLPATRKEDTQFRQQLREHPETASWQFADSVSHTRESDCRSDLDFGITFGSVVLEGRDPRTTTGDVSANAARSSQRSNAIPARS